MTCRKVICGRFLFYLLQISFVSTYQKAIGKRIKNELSLLCQLLLDPEMIDVKGRIVLTSWALHHCSGDEVSTEDP